MGVETRTEVSAGDGLLRAQMDEALTLARRMRELRGEPLQSDDFEAIAEATGADARHLAQLQDVELGGRKARMGLRLVGQYRALDSELRKYVGAGLAAVPAALFSRFGDLADRMTWTMLGARYGIFQQIALLFALAGLVVCARARTLRAAAGAGAAFGVAFCLLHSVFALLFLLPVEIPSMGLLAYLIGGAGVGALAQFLYTKGIGKVKIADPEERRHAMLTQMQELRDQLHGSEKFLCFLSVDVVGSSQMKDSANVLDIEFTMREYHRYVERIARKYGGDLHSTAGDGLTLAFEDAGAALMAAKNTQLGLSEFNAHMNKTARPLEVRCGIHAGETLTVGDGELTDLKFSSIIDVAAHMQKACPPGGVAMSESAAARVPGGISAVGHRPIETPTARGVLWTPRRLAEVGS